MAEPIALGDTIKSIASGIDCVISEELVAEYWGLTLSQPVRLRIEASSQTVWVFAELRASDSTLVASADNGGTDADAVIEEDVGAGSYVIVISSYYSGGSYQLVVRAVGGP